MMHVWLSKLIDENNCRTACIKIFVPFQQRISDTNPLNESAKSPNEKGKKVSSEQIKLASVLPISCSQLQVPILTLPSSCDTVRQCGLIAQSSVGRTLSHMVGYCWSLSYTVGHGRILTGTVGHGRTLSDSVGYCRAQWDTVVHCRTRSYTVGHLPSILKPTNHPLNHGSMLSDGVWLSLSYHQITLLESY